MKVINKPIAMICIFTDGEPKPIRFRITDENDEQQVYNIAHIVSKSKERDGKDIIWRFNCFVVMNGFQRLCQIRYNLSNTMWHLYKI